MPLTHVSGLLYQGWTITFLSVCMCVWGVEGGGEFFFFLFSIIQFHAFFIMTVDFCQNFKNFDPSTYLFLFIYLGGRGV